MPEVVAGEGPGAKTASFVIDLDGVLYLHDQAVSGAGEALQSLADGGHRLVFVTNNSTRTAADVATRIEAKTGFSPDPRWIVTSGQATGHHLQGRVQRALVIGSEGLADTLRDFGIVPVDDWRMADVVVVGLDVDFDYPRLAAATSAVRNGADFVATNLDATYPTPTGLAPGGGAMAAAIAVAADTEPLVCGKPHEPIRALVRTKVTPGPVWVVGDRPETDLAMAKVEGWSCVLVLSGVTTSPEHVPEAFRPDVVLDSVADLPQVLE